MNESEEERCFRILKRPSYNDLKHIFEDYVSIQTRKTHWKIFSQSEDYPLHIREMNIVYSSWDKVMMEGMYCIEKQHWTLCELLDASDPDDSSQFQLWWFIKLLHYSTRLPFYNKNTNEWEWSKEAAEDYYLVHKEYPEGRLLEE